MSFVRRKIDVTLSLAAPNLPGVNGNTVVARGLRVNATITKVTTLLTPTAEVVIYGLPLAVMNALYTIGGMPGFGSGNTISVSAGDDLNGMSEVFSGNVWEGYADLNRSPESPFMIKATAGPSQIANKVPGQSFATSDVASVMSTLAQQAGLQFENNGVSGTVLPQQYLAGTLTDMMTRVSQATGIRANIDRGTLRIWPSISSVTSDAVATISAETGMIGYPTYSNFKIAVDTEFNPAISPGNNIEIKSIITPACGTWSALNVQHRLASEDPSGPWLTHIECQFANLAPIVEPPPSALVSGSSNG